MGTRARCRLPACAAAVALMLAGCGVVSGADSSSGTSTEASAEMREVQSEFGPVTLPAEPKRALGMYTTDVDMLIELGIPLAPSQPIRDQYAGFPSFFPQEALEGIGTFKNFPEFNYEAIMAAQPDFILNGLGYEKEVVERLPEIAPTYSIDMFDGTTDWRVGFKKIATALDRVAEYEAWMASYQKKVDDLRARLDKAGVDPVVAPVNYGDGGVRVICSNNVPCLVFEDLGLEVAPLAKGKGTELSLEQLEQLEGIDVAFRLAQPEEDGSLDDTALADLRDNQLWNSLPFVAGDEYHAFDMEMVYGSPSGQEAFLNVVEKALLG